MATPYLVVTTIIEINGEQKRCLTRVENAKPRPGMLLAAVQSLTANVASECESAIMPLYRWTEGDAALEEECIVLNQWWARQAGTTPGRDLAKEREELWKRWQSIMGLNFDGEELTDEEKAVVTRAASFRQPANNQSAAA